MQKESFWEKNSTKINLALASLSIFFTAYTIYKNHLDRVFDKTEALKLRQDERKFQQELAMYGQTKAPEISIKTHRALENAKTSGEKAKDALNTANTAASLVSNLSTITQAIFYLGVALKWWNLPGQAATNTK